MQGLKLAGILLAGAAAVLAAEHAREYKIAKVLDSSSTNESWGMTNANGSTFNRVTVQTNQLVLLGDDYVYVIADERQKSGGLIPLPAVKLGNVVANRHHGCRFIVGETVSYAQEKGDLYVIDADGKECKVPIVRQQKRAQ